MSTARWGKKWADVDEDDEDEEGVSSPKSKTRFETQADEHGIKTVIEYKEKDGKTYKVTRRVKVTTTAKWTNKAMEERKELRHFGKADTDEAKHIAKPVRSEEDVPIELTRKMGVAVVVNDAEDKFLEESLTLVENLTKEKKVWTDMNRSKQEDREEETKTAGPAPNSVQAAMAGGADGGPAKPAGSTYVPPSLRNGKGDGKGDGKSNQDEASLRVTNLSEDVKEGDLQELFGQFGRLQRVYLAKDMATFLSKGFAFVTYYNKADAQKAINKLHGHGYDNLIMQVMWAKPKV